MPTEPNEKRCKQCGLTKTRDAFYAHPTTSDGLLHVCIECKIAVSKEQQRRLRADPKAYQAKLKKVREYKRNQRKQRARLTKKLS